MFLADKDGNIIRNFCNQGGAWEEFKTGLFDYLITGIR